MHGGRNDSTTEDLSQPGQTCDEESTLCEEHVIIAEILEGEISEAMTGLHGCTKCLIETPAKRIEAPEAPSAEPCAQESQSIASEREQIFPLSSEITFSMDHKSSSCHRAIPSTELATKMHPSRPKVDFPFSVTDFPNPALDLESKKPEWIPHGIISLKEVALFHLQKQCEVDEELLSLYAYTGRNIRNVKLAAEFLLAAKCYKHAFCLYTILLARYEELLAEDAMKDCIASAVFGCALSWTNKTQFNAALMLIQSLQSALSTDLFSVSQDTSVLLFANSLRSPDKDAYFFSLNKDRHNECLWVLKPCLRWCLEALAHYDPICDFPKGLKPPPTERVGLMCYLWRCMHRQIMEENNCSTQIKWWLGMVEHRKSHSLSDMLAVATDMIFWNQGRDFTRFSRKTIERSLVQCREITNFTHEELTIHYRWIMAGSGMWGEGLFQLISNFNDLEYLIESETFGEAQHNGAERLITYDYKKRTCVHDCSSLLVFLRSVLVCEEPSMPSMDPFSCETVPPRLPQVHRTRSSILQPLLRTINEYLSPDRRAHISDSHQSSEPVAGATNLVNSDKRSSKSSSRMSFISGSYLRNSYQSMVSYLTSSSMSSFRKIDARAKAIIENSAHGTYDQLPSTALRDSQRSSLGMGSMLTMESVQEDDSDTEMLDS